MRRALLLLSLLASACSGGHGVEASGGGPRQDGGTGPDGAPAPAPDGARPGGGGRCVREADRIRCTHQDIVIESSALLSRRVYFEIPTAAPPAAGHPVAILFQGSFFDASTFWEAEVAAPYGGVHQVELVDELLRRGFAVVTPDAALGTYWNTNAPPWSLAWDQSPDRALMDALLAKIASGELGAMDPSRLYAAGISSGGYMTSRMALAYPDRFRALAIHSASYATCSGRVCRVPDDLPASHPPTLFLHGEKDDVVPIETAASYEAALSSRGIGTGLVRDPTAGHAWIAESPTRIAAWFAQH